MRLPHAQQVRFGLGINLLPEGEEQQTKFCTPLSTWCTTSCQQNFNGGRLRIIARFCKRNQFNVGLVFKRFLFRRGDLLAGVNIIGVPACMGFPCTSFWTFTFLYRTQYSRHGQPFPERMWYHWVSNGWHQIRKAYEWRCRWHLSISQLFQI